LINLGPVFRSILDDFFVVLQGFTVHRNDW
jgi:hypothetical protein